MKRRTALRATGTALCLAVAGCVGNDDSSDSPSGNPDSDATGAENNDADDSGQIGNDTESENGGDSGNEASFGDASGVRAMVEELFEAFATGDPDTINSHLHAEAPLEPVDEETANSYGENPPQIAEMEVAEVTTESATVDIQMTFPDQDGTESLLMELRKSAGEWKLWDTKPGGGDVPRAAFRFEFDGETVEIAHDGGNSISADNLIVRGRCLEATGNWRELDGAVTGDDGTVVVSDSVSIPATGSCAVTVVWDDGSDSAVLSERMIGDDTREEDTKEQMDIDDDVPEEVAEYLRDAENFDGSIVDWTGQSEAEIGVGTGENRLGFEPAAIRVSPGTTIVWEWSGEGGAHNVVAEDGSFESELVSEPDERFEYTFEQSGIGLYFCQPHKAIGMKGAVVVAEE